MPKTYRPATPTRTLTVLRRGGTLPCISLKPSPPPCLSLFAASVGRVCALLQSVRGHPISLLRHWPHPPARSQLPPISPALRSPHFLTWPTAIGSATWTRIHQSPSGRASKQRSLKNSWKNERNVWSSHSSSLILLLFFFNGRVSCPSSAAECRGVEGPAEGAGVDRTHRHRKVRSGGVGGQAADADGPGHLRGLGGGPLPHQYRLLEAVFCPAARRHTPPARHRLSQPPLFGHRLVSGGPSNHSHHP